jgi:hypothetical protein
VGYSFSPDLPFLFTHPEQESTGSRGYLGNRGSFAESSHSQNTEPRLDSTRRACAHSKQSPTRFFSSRPASLLPAMAPE